MRIVYHKNTHPTTLTPPMGSDPRKLFPHPGAAASHPARNANEQRTSPEDILGQQLVVEGQSGKKGTKGSAPVLLDNPVLSHVDVIPKTRLLYQFYCINKLTLHPPLDASRRACARLPSVTGEPSEAKTIFSWRITLYEPSRRRIPAEV